MGPKEMAKPSDTRPVTSRFFGKQQPTPDPSSTTDNEDSLYGNLRERLRQETPGAFPEERVASIEEEVEEVQPDPSDDDENEPPELEQQVKGKAQVRDKRDPNFEGRRRNYQPY